MKRARLPARPSRLAVGACALLAAAASPALAGEGDLTQLSIEQLLDVEVVSASKYAQRMADAPAAVTVLRAADIRQFGYRTLADVLRSVRGFYVSSDHQYSYVGVRGFSPPGDYNTRLLVLVDGYRINDNIYDTGAISGEFPLDVDLIDRVEIVRGPGSSVYGGNALFGVVNVITRRGRDLNGGEAALAAGSHRDREGRLSWGKRLDSGLEVLVSASGLTDDGGKLYFPEFADPATHNGQTRGTDFERRRQFAAKLGYGGWDMTVLSSRRDKGAPGGAFGTDFNDPGTHIVDAQDSVNLAYHRFLDNGMEADFRLFGGQYKYRGYYIYSGRTNRDTGDGSWWGGEMRFVAPLGRHKLVYGAEYQHNGRQNQQNFDESPYVLNIDEPHRSTRYGAYIQDDFNFAERWTLTAGLRYDHASHTQGGGNLSPRLGLIHQNGGGSVFKLLYGSAYRTPNVYERYYAYPGQQIANPELLSERVKTYEAIWEKDFAGGLHMVSSLYYYRVSNWIVSQSQEDPTTGAALSQYVNSKPVSARGFEIEADRQWQDGTRLRASYSAQFAPEHNGGGLNQVPRHLVKANLSTPLWNPNWRSGLEYQYTSGRATTDARVAGYGLANATLLYRASQHGPEVALSIYNLFDKRFDDPNVDPGVPTRESMVQNGRTWRLKLTVPF